MYNNNWNNGNFNNGFNGFNGGFNNNFNGIMNTVQFTADTIIMEIEQAIQAVLSGATRNTLHVRDVVKTMIQQGKLKMIGGGQNRVALEIIPDHTRYKQILGINGPMLIMVPVKLPEGILDNKRAASGYQYVRNVLGNMNNMFANLVKSTYLPSVLIPNTNILAQKRIIRIEDSNGVRALLNSNKYDPVHQIGGACRDYLLENPTVKAQYESLIRAYDEYFVMADLNAEFSPWNFGFDIETGREMLKIIDYGYVIPKTVPNKCPICGQELRYCVPRESWLKDHKSIEVQVGTFGQYSCKNPNCSHRVNGKVSPYIERDIDVFLRYTNR